MSSDFKNDQRVIVAVIEDVFSERHAEIIEHIKKDGFDVTLKYVYPPIKLRLAKNNVFINLADEGQFKVLIAEKFNLTFKN